MFYMLFIVVVDSWSINKISISNINIDININRVIYLRVPRDTQYYNGKQLN